MKKPRSLRSIISIVLLLIFLFQIAYLMYRVHQVLILGMSFPNDVKLSAVIAGICLGLMYMLKGYTSPFRKDDDTDPDEFDEE